MLGEGSKNEVGRKRNISRLDPKNFLENPVLVGGDIYFFLNDPSDLHGQTGLNG
jgi:hypothetical protein